VWVNPKRKENIMPSAFVLINSEIGAEEEVLKDLRKIENVREAYVVVNLAPEVQGLLLV
jgi:hypothetical protein